MRAIDYADMKKGNAYVIAILTKSKERNLYIGYASEVHGYVNHKCSDCTGYENFQLSGGIVMDLYGIGGVEVVIFEIMGFFFDENDQHYCGYTMDIFELTDDEAIKHIIAEQV